MRRVFVNPDRPHRDAVQEAAKIIRRGGLVAIPTDTLYGLAANPFCADAVARVFEAKGRPAGRALPLIASDVDQVTSHLGALPRLGARLASTFWPGPLTLLIPAPRSLAPDVSAGTGRVGIRVPDDVVARAVCRAVGCPITSTSANPSGGPGTVDADEVERSLGHLIDLIIDGGRTHGGPPSTIVDVTGVAPGLIRAGAISWEQVQACVTDTEQDPSVPRSSA